MGTGKWTREGHAGMIGDQVGVYSQRRWVIVSSSLCLPRQRGSNKWLGCHLEKQFNNSFVYGVGQKGLLWRAGHRWSEWKRHTHTHPSTHTYAQKKKGPVLKSASSPGCTPYATVADNLLSRLMLRNAHKHMLVHARKSFLFYNCSTFPAQRSFLAYWCAIVFMWAAKIRIYQLIEMPGGVSSPTHWATSVHTYP